MNLKNLDKKGEEIQELVAECNTAKEKFRASLKRLFTNEPDLSHEEELELLNEQIKKVREVKIPA